LQLDFVARIEAVLSVEVEPSSAIRPAIESDGNIIKLQPELIARREVINVSLLSEGSIGPVTIALNPLIDVKIEIKDREVIEARRNKLRAWTPVLLAFVTLVITALAAYLTYNTGATDNTRTNAVVGSTLCLSLSEFNETTWLAMELVNRDITVSRVNGQRIRSIKFAKNYDEDVQTVDDTSRFLVAGYQGVGTAQANKLAAEVQQAVAAIRILPEQGTGNAANHDLAEFTTVLRLLPNLNVSFPGCKQ
jgi:hypothetical protein